LCMMHLIESRGETEPEMFCTVCGETYGENTWVEMELA
jgi:hypothetical protein